ncbi:hypothetical protein ACWDOP_37610 [Nocardia sp. NPDC003693]
MGSRPRAALGLLVAVLALIVALSGCTTKESGSGAAASSTPAATSVSVTKTTAPASSAAVQDNPGGAGYRADPAAPESSYYHSPEAPAPGGEQPGTDTCGATYCGPPGTDNCGGEVVCGVPAEKCTDRNDYTGDVRSNEEINSIGERDGRCPAILRATTTSQLPVTTTAPTTSPAVTTTVATTEAPPATTVPATTAAAG